MLTDAEIAARFAAVNRSRGRGRVPITCFARHANMSRPTFYKIMRSGRVPEKRRTWLSILCASLERRALAFERRRQRWQEIRRTPPDPLPLQERIVRAEEADEWAACRVCAGNSWHVAFHGARSLIVCASCVPLGQFPALGYSSSPPSKA